MRNIKEYIRRFKLQDPFRNFLKKEAILNSWRKFLPWNWCRVYAGYWSTLH